MSYALGSWYKMCCQWRSPKNMIKAEKKTQEGWVAKPSIENLDSMVEAGKRPQDENWAAQPAFLHC